MYFKFIRKYKPFHFSYRSKILIIFIIGLFFVINCQDQESQKENDYNKKDNWSEIWTDDFEGDTLDTSKWNKLNWRPGWVNNENQAYTDRDTNIYLKDGFLIIQGLIEPGYYGKDYTGYNYNADYTSGRVNTDKKFSKTYGRFDVRAKLPKGRGSWPAIWMLGDNISTIGWPLCGEIDIMEHVGYEEGLIHGSIHTDMFNHNDGTQKSGSHLVPTATDSFHTYSLEWTPNYLRYLIDNEPFFFVYNDSDGDNRKWPFDQPHYIILNLAIGGDWGGVQGISTTDFPMKMLIDYVKISEKSELNVDIEVLFQVDMQDEIVSGSGVRISGGSLGSGQPGGIRMASVDNTNVWQVRLVLPQSSNFTYKYRNGYFPDTWLGGWETVNENCVVGTHNNRFISLAQSDTILPLVCFNSCEECR